jgi:hypothetical protein
VGVYILLAAKTKGTRAVFPINKNIRQVDSNIETPLGKKDMFKRVNIEGKSLHSGRTA